MSIVQCVVLTDDFYLYTGIVSSLTEFICYQMSLSDDGSKVNYGANPFILVDSRIFFSRCWSGFDALIEKYPCSDILLLPHRYGNNFIIDEIIYPPLSQVSDSSSFKMAVLGFIEERQKSNRRKMKELTPLEIQTLMFFSSGYTVSKIFDNFKWQKKEYTRTELTHQKNWV